MDYYTIEPEVAGELGEGTVMDTSVHPPCVSAVHYVITDWLGDDIIESFPCYLVTRRLAADLEASRLTGFRLDAARVTLSEGAADFGTSEVPAFRWLVVVGRPGEDDFGVLVNGQAVISERALQVLRAHTLDNCDIEPYNG
ncbi:MAG: hypothetical protein J2P25_01495 [Nocardiopsaceae bacterium]|nr:hypothetical protein [Nocardiopsaceae bacterium]